MRSITNAVRRSTQLRRGMFKAAFHKIQEYRVRHAARLKFHHGAAHILANRVPRQCQGTGNFIAGLTVRDGGKDLALAPAS